jgi:hypothetical protein
MTWSSGLLTTYGRCEEVGRGKREGEREGERGREREREGGERENRGE